VRDGFATAFGEDGLELAPPDGTRNLGDLLRLNAASTVELRAALGESLVLPVRVAYFGPNLWGLRIAETVDAKLVGRYRRWLLEAKHQQAQRDLERFSPGGLEARSLSVQREGTRSGALARILVDRDPLLLVLAEGSTFPTRLAEAVGRKYGVAALDTAKGPLSPLLGPLGAEEGGWGRVRLVLIHHRIRGGTPLERCKALAQGEGCPLPILIGGTEEDADQKRNRAAAAGAVNYLVIEPFHVLKVLRALDEALRLFA
jgi:CheY-like chemotaxis protein